MGAAHSSQNFALASFSCWHRRHFIARLGSAPALMSCERRPELAARDKRSAHTERDNLRRLSNAKSASGSSCCYAFPSTRDRTAHVSSVIVVSACSSLTLFARACASQEKFLDSRQAQAVQTAVSGKKRT